MDALTECLYNFQINSWEEYTFQGLQTIDCVKSYYMALWTPSTTYTTHVPYYYSYIWYDRVKVFTESNHAS